MPSVGRKTYKATSVSENVVKMQQEKKQALLVNKNFEKCQTYDTSETNTVVVLEAEQCLFYCFVETTSVDNFFMIP
jgi:hypothetical protein